MRSQIGRRGERGATLVEFAIIALCMFTTLFGIVEICRLVLTYSTMATAARAATRYAITHGFNRSGTGADGPSGLPAGGFTTTEVKNVAASYATGAGLQNFSTSNVAATYQVGNGNSSATDLGANLVGDLVTVTISYSFQPIVGLIPLGVTLNTSSQGVICF